MTASEKETYRTTKMKIAATKVDDYSDWGKKRKTDADTAHAEGKKSQQDIKDQRVIDSRDSSRYDWKVIRPQRAKEAEVLRQRALTKKALNDTYGKKQLKGRSDPTISGSGRTSLAGRLSGRGGQLPPVHKGGKKKPSRFNTPKGYTTSSGGRLRPWDTSITKVGNQALTKDGWTPKQAAEYGGNWLAGGARQTQAALPGVFQGGPGGAALYGGTGKGISPAANVMVAGSTVMSKKTRESLYGQGLGSIKTRTILSKGSGGQ